jgi:hypothetical protein
MSGLESVIPLAEVPALEETVSPTLNQTASIVPSKGAII